MPAELLDFQCYVGKYEIKRFDELPADSQLHELAAEVYGDAAEFLQADFDASPDVPYLVLVGPAKLLKPERKTLDYAVGLLLQTKIDKLSRAQTERSHAIRKKLKSCKSRREEQRVLDKFRIEPINFDPEELSKLKRNVLSIARCIGMLIMHDQDYQWDQPGFILAEPLSDWIAAASSIQIAFGILEHHDFDLPPQLISVHDYLEILLSKRLGEQPLLHIHPTSTRAALIYRAAQMVAQGTASQVCKNCGTLFLEGGERDLRKKRAGSRFCSDKCRYEYHNEKRRKAKQKS
jgi:hypothetical protein